MANCTLQFPKSGEHFPYENFSNSIIYRIGQLPASVDLHIKFVLNHKTQRHVERITKYGNSQLARRKTSLRLCNLNLCTSHVQAGVRGFYSINMSWTFQIG